MRTLVIGASGATGRLLVEQVAHSWTRCQGGCAIDRHVNTWITWKGNMPVIYNKAPL